MTQPGFRILLIDLNRDVFAHGVRHLAAYLRDRGVHASVLFLPGDDDPLFGPVSPGRLEAVARFARSFDLVGISLLTHHMFPRAEQLAARLRGEIRAPILWGGVPVISSPESFLRHGDYACAGEGEELLRGLAERLPAGEPVSDLANLAFVDADGKPRLNPMAPFVDVSNYPACVFDPENFYLVRDRVVGFAEDPSILERDSRERGYTLLTVRGCPFACTYCCNSALRKRYRDCGPALRRHGLPSVMAELEHARRLLPGLGMMKFDEDDFFERDEQDLDAFAAAYGRRVDLPFWCNGSVRHITAGKIEALRRHKLRLEGIKLGLQSGSGRTNREIYRRWFDPDVFRERLGMLHEAGIAVIIDIITGNPFEGIRERSRTYRYLAELVSGVYGRRATGSRRATVLAHKLVFYPGTELFRRAMEEGAIGADYVEKVLYTSSSHAGRDANLPRKGADWLGVTVFNRLRAPRPAAVLLRLLGLPAVYALLDSAPCRATLRTAYALMKRFRALVRKRGGGAME